MTEVKFSVTTFVKYIENHKQQVYDMINKSRFYIVACKLYVEPNETEFKGSKYKQIYIKPIAISFESINYVEYILLHKHTAYDRLSVF